MGNVNLWLFGWVVVMMMVVIMLDGLLFDYVMLLVVKVMGK